MKNLIKQAGFKSQKDLAKQTGNTEATISKWVNKPTLLFELFILSKTEVSEQRKKIERLEKFIKDRL